MAIVCTRTCDKCGRGLWWMAKCGSTYCRKCPGRWMHDEH